METFEKIMEVAREILIVTSITIGFITVCFVVLCISEVRKDKRQ